MNGTIRSLTRLTLAGSMVLTLGGCLFPPAVTVATLTVDNISYMVTGKGFTDHLLSGATERDCSVTRIFRGEPLCSDPLDGSMMAEEFEVDLDGELDIGTAMGPDIDEKNDPTGNLK